MRVSRRILCERKRTLSLFFLFLIISAGINSVIFGRSIMHNTFYNYYLYREDLCITTEVIDNDTVKKISEIHGVEDLTAHIIKDCEYSFNEIEGKGLAVAFGGTLRSELGKVYVSRGRAPSQGEVMIGNNMYLKKEVSIGDYISLYNKKYKISGFASCNLYSLSSLPIFYMNYNDLKDMDRTFMKIYIKVSNEVPIVSIEDRIRELLLTKKYRVYGIQVNNPDNYPYRDIINSYSEYMFLITLSILSVSIVTIIFLLLIGISQRLKELGMLKAIGIPSSGIITLYILPDIVRIFLGYICGILLAYPFSNTMASMFFGGSMHIESPDYNNFSLVNIIILFIIFFLLILPLFRTYHVSTHKLLKMITIIKPRKMKIFGFLIFSTLLLSSLTVNMTANMEVKEMATYAPPFDAIAFFGREIDRVEDLEDTYTEKWISLPLIYENTTCHLFGVPVTTSIKSKIISGEWLTKENDVVVGEHICIKNDLMIGDIIKIDVWGKQLKLRICGIAKDYYENGNILYIPIEKLENIGLKPNTLVFKMKNRNVRDIRKILEKYDYSKILTSREIQEATEANLKIFSSFIAFFFFLSVLLSVVSIAGILYTDLLENKRWIAILRSIGIPSTYIFKFYFPQVFLPTTLGVVISVALSRIYGEFAFSKLSLLNPSIWRYAICTLMVLPLGVFLQLIVLFLTLKIYINKLPIIKLIKGASE